MQAPEVIEENWISKTGEDVRHDDGRPVVGVQCLFELPPQEQRQERATLAAAAPRMARALRQLWERYKASPDGPLGRGLLNSHFFAAKTALSDAGCIFDDEPPTTPPNGGEVVLPLDVAKMLRRMIESPRIAEWEDATARESAMAALRKLVEVTTEPV